MHVAVTSTASPASTSACTEANLPTRALLQTSSKLPEWGKKPCTTAPGVDWAGWPSIHTSFQHPPHRVVPAGNGHCCGSPGSSDR